MADPFSGDPFAGGNPFAGGAFNTPASQKPADLLRNAATSGDLGALVAILAKPEVTSTVLDSVDSGYFGGTALSFAAEGGHADAVAALLEAGASPGLPDRQGFTALHLAARHGHAACVEQLLLAAAPPDARDGQKLTPLHLAANKGKTEVARLLLQHGASVDAVGGEARTTALWRAVEAEHIDLALVLIAAHADPLLCDSVHRETPLHLAARDGHTTVSPLRNLVLACDCKPFLRECLCSQVVAALLTENPTLVDAKDWMRSTPLHVAPTVRRNIKAILGDCRRASVFGLTLGWYWHSTISLRCC